MGPVPVVRQPEHGNVAAAGPQEFIASERPFATRGKLGAMTKEPSRIARSAPTPWVKSVLLNSAFASPI